MIAELITRARLKHEKIEIINNVYKPSRKTKFINYN